MIEWIKAHLTEMGLILAGIPIIISVVAGAFHRFNYTEVSIRILEAAVSKGN